METSAAAPAPEASLHAANLRWFALIYLAISAAVTALMFALAQMNIDPPTGGLATGAFLGAVSAAGLRQAKKTDNTWTPADRAALAGGYVLVAFGVSLMACGVLAAIAAVTLGSAFSALALAFFKQYGLIVMGAFLFIAGIYYLGARFILGGIAKRERRRLAQ
jgi:hypothetical protein